MKAVIVSWVMATVSGLCGLAVSALVFVNINGLPYAGAMFALAVVVIGWFPFIVSCYEVKREWDAYQRAELRKLARRRRYR